MASRGEESSSGSQRSAPSWSYAGKHAPTGSTPYPNRRANDTGRRHDDGRPLTYAKRRCSPNSMLGHDAGTSMWASDQTATPTSAAMRPFFSFYGGKWRDAVKNYPSPAYETIVEPFAGSAGYSVRYYDRRVILGEKDPVIFAVWDYLLHASADEIRAIPDLAEGQSTTDLDVPQEARWLVGLWLNRAAARPRTGPSAWMRDGIRPGSFWGERVRNTVASQVDRIRHWEIHNCSYEDLPVTGEATWFIDPPYQNQGRHYHHGADGIDFDELGSWARSRPGQVIVCEQEGANWLPFQSLAMTKTTRADMRSHEVIWTSDRPVGGGQPCASGD